MKVGQCMMQQLITLRPENTLGEAALIMSKVWVSGTPVVNDKNNLVGIISEADILEFIHGRIEQGPDVKEVSTEESGTIKRILALENDPGSNETVDRLNQATVQEVMIKEPVTIEPEADVIEAAHLMNLYRINRLPVVQDGRLIGLITRGDILTQIVMDP